MVCESSVKSIFGACGLSVSVQNLSLYETALAQPSASLGTLVERACTKELFENALLGLVCAMYPATVKRASLARHATRLGIDAFLDGPHDDALLADAFESFVAARYVDVLGDQGDVGAAFAEARAFVVAAMHVADKEDEKLLDIKTGLNELCLEA